MPLAYHQGNLSQVAFSLYSIIPLTSPCLVRKALDPGPNQMAGSGEGSDFCEKIIGGHDVKPHSRPYMVLLETESSLCAGALIEKGWLEKPATINKNVKILRPPQPRFTGKNDVKPNTRCRVAGCGKDDNGESSDTLKEVEVTVIDRKICNDEKHYNYTPEIGPYMICAGNPKGKMDSCEGDSGSPLICNKILRGITSFGRPGKCGDPHSPGVYTLLAEKHLIWIQKIMRDSWKLP
ncbi:PREDICTED: granzyme A-like [Condylura cristata]|uniref:granzyme A-like n=1 Tax=Condylura cristata TaxID=143302 RepID=UPI0006437A1D|nr:PREDICTED: granzyme A-like [Condylura cristata]